MKERSKYNSKKCEFDGHKFDSKDEMLYYQYLRTQQCFQNFQIEFQPSFELIPNYVYQGKKHRGITYTADFKLIFPTLNCFEIIDIKGMETQQGNIRRKLFEYRYPQIFLQWISRSQKYGESGWIDYDELKRIRKSNKKGEQK